MSNTDYILEQIVDKSRAARDGHFGVLSTGEKLAAAFVLNRPDLLERADYTMAEAVYRLEGDWLKRIPEAARILQDEAQAAEDARNEARRVTFAQAQTLMPERPRAAAEPMPRQPPSSGLLDANGGITRDDLVSMTDVMLCWNPNSADVRLVPWPDTGMVSDNYLHTHFACMDYVHEASFEERKLLAFITASQLIVRDRCDPYSVHKTMCRLEEYQAGLSLDTPGVLQPED
ncbi:hypothetical protein [Luteimonas sp. MHLX1A]|uniref:hypothetical protein n=1 Tax=Alterluteimonas muca TaxID=2878684 RepID=UPI001E63E0CF|nr:hypothetical protein [Luteimonas sp. MHLX1A]MCD9046795.1 hypothetical protein [Luteimonas sp. MHLX1A]